MIYVVDSSNRFAYRKQLEKLPQLLPPIADHIARETDRFDTDDTVYLLGLDEVGRVLSGLRLHPTIDSHLVNGSFPQPAAIERSPGDNHVCEITRYCALTEHARASSRVKASGELLVAMLEFALSTGRTEITLLGDVHPLASGIEVEWQVERLPGPRSPENSTWAAVCMEISYDVANSAREAAAIYGPVLTYKPTPPPYAVNDNAMIRAV
jgi:N-acyl-L-homoserine lactone synthetase